MAWQSKLQPLSHINIYSYLHTQQAFPHFQYLSADYSQSHFDNFGNYPRRLAFTTGLYLPRKVKNWKKTSPQKYLWIWQKKAANIHNRGWKYYNRFSHQIEKFQGRPKLYDLRIFKNNRNFRQPRGSHRRPRKQLWLVTFHKWEGNSQM